MRLDLFTKGEIIDYQTTIEEVVGPWLSKLKIYNNNDKNETEINGHTIEKNRAYFVADADYEIIVRKKTKTNPHA